MLMTAIAQRDRARATAVDLEQRLTACRRIASAYMDLFSGEQCGDCLLPLWHDGGCIVEDGDL